MTYREKLVAVIKSNGRVLREADSTVTLPFGSEFSILIKNLDSKRIQVGVSIDGQDTTEGRRLIIGPNQSMELERFIRNGNLSAGNKFKFIERTEAIEQHRGIAADDGIVRVEAWTELVPQVRYEQIVHTHTYWPPQYPQCRSFHGGSRGILRGSSDAPGFDSGMVFANYSSTAPSTSSTSNNSAPVSDAGITVPGSESNQQFYDACGFPLEDQSNVIVLRLRGQVNGAPVAQPITVNTKAVCVTCGTSNSLPSRFCSNCGTALTII